MVFPCNWVCAFALRAQPSVTARTVAQVTVNRGMGFTSLLRNIPTLPKMLPHQIDIKLIPGSHAALLVPVAGGWPQSLGTSCLLVFLRSLWCRMVDGGGRSQNWLSAN